MSIEDNKAILRRYYNEVLNQRNVALIDELFASDFKARCSNYPEIGLDHFRQAVNATLAAIPDLSITIEDQIAEADKVVTRWTARGSHRGEFLIPATGQPLVLTAIHIHRVAADKILDLWEEINLLNVIQPDGNLAALIERLKGRL